MSSNIENCFFFAVSLIASPKDEADKSCVSVNKIFCLGTIFFTFLAVACIILSLQLKEFLFELKHDLSALLAKNKH